MLSPSRQKDFYQQALNVEQWSGRFRSLFKMRSHSLPPQQSLKDHLLLLTTFWIQTATKEVEGCIYLKGGFSLTTPRHGESFFL